VAINYLKDVSETNFLFSHNNNVIEFSSDITDPIRDCIITVGTSIVTLYPRPDGSFYYNFKEVVSSLINTNNYTDDLNTDVSVSYVYTWDSRVYLDLDVTISINFTNDTSDQDTKDLKFILSAVNLRDYNNRFPVVSNLIDPFVLLPKITVANNTYYAKYFDGYPFDLTLFNGIDDNTDIDITNLTNAVSFTFTKNLTDKFVRLVFSDGRTTSTIEDVLPLVSGLNKLELISLDGDDNSFIHLEKDQGCSGVYLKWLNDSGGYSYWLFNNNASRRGYKEKGYLNNDFNNLEDTTSQQISLGLESKDTLAVYDRNLNENQKNLIATILDSPKVYLFTGTPFAQNNFNDWMEIKNKTRRYDLKQVKRDLFNISLSFELPNNYNIYL
jgi:hypothetical protein